MLQSIAYLQEKFKKYKFPTQQDFWDLFDSFWHKKEKIPAGQIDGLQQVFDAATEGFGKALAEKQDKTDNALQTEDKTVAGAINELNARANNSNETGQVLPVIGIIGAEEETEPETITDGRLSALLTKTNNLANIIAEYNNPDLPGFVGGTMSQTGTPSIGNSSTSYSRHIGLGTSSSLTFTNPNAEIKSVIFVFSTGGTRNMLMTLDSGFSMTVPLPNTGSSNSQETVIIEPFEAGSVHSFTVKSQSSTINVLDVIIEYAGESAALPTLPENADAGDRYILKDESGERIMEFDGTEWGAESVSEGFSVRVISDNNNEYVFENGVFVPREKHLREWVEEIDSAIEIAENDIEELREQIENLPEIPTPFDPSGLIPKSDFDGSAISTPYGTKTERILMWIDGFIYSSTGVSPYLLYAVYDSFGNRTISRAIQYGINSATQSAAGVMSAADKVKLNGIESGAQVNEVTAVSLTETLTQYLTESETYQAIAESEVGLFNFKGTKGTRAELPTEAADFDVYKITDEQVAVFALNIDNALVWKTLAPEFDLTGYETTAGATEKANAALAAAKTYADTKKTEAVTTANSYTDAVAVIKQDVLESYVKSVAVASNENSFTLTNTTKELQAVPDESEGAESGATVTIPVETQQSITLVAGNGVKMTTAETGQNKTVTLEVQEQIYPVIGNQDEIIIGKSADGKNIYRRSIYFHSSQLTAQGFLTVDLGQSGVPVERIYGAKNLYSNQVGELTGACEVNASNANTVNQTSVVTFKPIGNIPLKASTMIIDFSKKE